MNSPKYKLNEKVHFKIVEDNREIDIYGKVYIIDAFGTFEQNEEPSYDIIVDDYKGTQCLFKHIRESSVEK